MTTLPDPSAGTEPLDLPSPEAAQATPLDPGDGAQWQGLPAAAAQVAMISGTIWGVLIGVAAAFFAGWPLRVAFDFPLLAWIALLAAVWLLVVVGGIWLGYLRWKHTAWKLDATGLHVRRGKWWRREILVPRSRVQHLDIERGPVERHFGLATLIVHTAGTRLHALRQPGFADADAVALRDALVPDSARHDDVV